MSQAFSDPGASLHRGVRLSLGHEAGTSAQHRQLHHKGKAQANVLYPGLPQSQLSLCPLHDQQELLLATGSSTLYPLFTCFTPSVLLRDLSVSPAPVFCPAILSPLHCCTCLPVCPCLRSSCASSFPQHELLGRLPSATGSLTSLSFPQQKVSSSGSPFCLRGWLLDA